MVELFKKLITAPDVAAIATSNSKHISIITYPIYAAVVEGDNRWNAVYFFAPTHGARIWGVGSRTSMVDFETCSWLEVVITMGLSQHQVEEMIEEHNRIHTPGNTVTNGMTLYR